MNTVQVIIFIVALIAIVALMYVVLPRLNLSEKSGKITRALIFLGIVGYLAFDFYIKGKYPFLVVLVLGSIAFFYMLISSKRK